MAWDELVATAPVPTPFLRSWWIGAVAGRNTVFVLWLEGDTLIGGLVVTRRHRVLGVPVYHFGGSGPLCPDHLDMLAAPGREATVCRAVAEWFRQPGSRVFDLDGLVTNSLMEATFGSAATTVVDAAPWDELPTDGVDYLAARSTKLRKTVRQTQRRLAAAGITHRRITSVEADAALRDFVRLHELRGGRDAILSEMPRLAPALVAGLAAGEVHIDVLASPERTVAMWISFQLEGAVRAYQSARLLEHDMRDATLILLLEVVRQACAEGCHEIDLLRGAEPYKARFVQRQREVRRLRVAHGPLGSLVLAALEAATRTRRLAGKVRRRLRNQRGAGFDGRSRRRAAE